MTTLQSRNHSRWIAALVIATSAIDLTSAQTMTRISEAGITAAAVDIAESGLVLGIIPDEIGNFSNPSGYIWDNNGTRTELKSGTFASLTFSSINDDGKVVGNGFDEAEMKAIVWINGEPTTLPDLGAGGRANSINNAGEIAGVVYRPGDFAFLPAKWSAEGVLTALDPLIPEGVLYQPFAEGSVINSNGTVAGRISTPANPSGFAFWTPLDTTIRNGPDLVMLRVGGLNSSGILAASGFNGGDGRISFLLDENNASTLLASATGYASSEVNGINDSNDVVGYSIDNLGESQFATVGTFWIDGKASRLTLPSGTFSELTAVNNDRIAVGTVTEGEDTFIAKFDLGEFAPPLLVSPTARATPGATVTLSAKSTNGAASAGQIVQFRWNKTVVGQSPVDKTGTARMRYKVPLNAAQKIHDVTASLPNRGYQVIGAPVVKGDIKLRLARPLNLKKASVISVTLINGSTSDPLASRTVSIQVGQRSYTARTNRSGVATIRIPRRDAPKGVKTYSVSVEETASHRSAFRKI